LLGNDKLCQSLFLLNPPASDRSLFGRAEANLHLQRRETSVKKEIIFVDLEESCEKDFKNSYTNEEEVYGLISYLKAYPPTGEFAVMSPFRTQAQLIKDTIEKEWK
jgi:hypothetical protein